MVKTQKQRNQPASSNKLPDSNHKHSQKHTSIVPKGLFNLGNTCYLNSCLQCLCRSPYLYEVLSSSPLVSATLRRPNNDSILTLKINIPVLRSSATDQFVKLCAMLRNFSPEQTTRPSLDPGAFRESILDKYQRFSGFGQQDSHELLRAVLDCMKQEELLRWRKGILDELKLDLNNLSPESRQTVRAWGKAASLATVVDRLFGGILIGSLQCTVCGTIRNNFEPFLDLSLPLADTKASGGRSVKETSNQVAKKSKRELKRERKKKTRRPKRSRVNRKLISSDGDTDIPPEPQSNDGSVSPVAEDHRDASPKTTTPMLILQPESKCTQNGATHSSSSPLSDMPVGSSNGDLADAEDTEEEFEPSNDVTDPYTGPEEVNGLEMSSYHLTEQLQRLHLDAESIEPFAHGELENASRLSQISLRSLVADPDEPTTTATCSLVSCLARFTSPEKLTGCNQIVCDRCSSSDPKDGKAKDKPSALRDFIRRDLILDPPPLLTIHLKRFQQYNNKLQKCQKSLSFPVMLDLSPFCSSLCNSPLSTLFYRLYGVVEHLGRLAEGHYVSYVAITEDDLHRPKPADTNDVNTFVQRYVGSFSKPPKWPLTPHDLVHRLRRCDRNQLLKSLEESQSVLNGQIDGLASPTSGEDNRVWFRCSDSHVTKVPLETVMSCQPFLLFYERISL